MNVALHPLPADDTDRGESSRALLFCHAAGYLGLIWREVSAHLQSGWPRFALDFHGHGETCPLPLNATWQVFRDDVAEAAACIHAAQLVGIGHSLGGTALLLAEASWPGTFAALACFEPIFATGFDPRYAESATRRSARFGSRYEAWQRLSGRAPFSEIASEVLCDYVEHGLANDPAGGVRLRCAPETEAHIYRTAADSGWSAALPEVRCPVTFLRGERSRVVSQESLVAAAARMPDARLRELEDVGHLGPLERPRAFACTIDHFISELG